MTSQPSLFPLPATVPSPICCYDGRCPRQGRATLGPVAQVSECCTVRAITCACGRTGVQSTNTEPREKTA